MIDINRIFAHLDTVESRSLVRPVTLTKMLGKPTKQTVIAILQTILTRPGGSDLVYTTLTRFIEEIAGPDEIRAADLELARFLMELRKQANPLKPLRGAALAHREDLALEYFAILSRSLAKGEAPNAFGKELTDLREKIEHRCEKLRDE